MKNLINFGLLVFGLNFSSLTFADTKFIPFETPNFNDHSCLGKFFGLYRRVANPCDCNGNPLPKEKPAKPVAK